MMETTLAETLILVREALCPLALFALSVGFFAAIIAAFQDGMPKLKRRHSVPCNYCAYFTGCHYLKCTVHPCKALTEDAADCLDFEPIPYQKRCCSKSCKS